MNDETDKSRYVKDPNLLVELCRDVIDLLDASSEEVSVAEQEAQLRAIAKAVEQLEKAGVTVPDPLRAEKTRLAASLAMHTDAKQALGQLADEFQDILQDLRERLGQKAATPEAKPRGKHSKSPKTEKAVWRKLIIEALTQLGGSAHKNDLYQKITRNYEDKFLPRDFEYLPDGKRIAWKNYCDWEGTLMRKEGLLKADSPRGVWELSEAHR